MAKMIEVARATGLALSTVSEILNGKPGYSDATRANVLDVSRKLNYRPNLISRALNGGKSMSIGLFFNRTVNGRVAGVHSQAIIESAARSHYRVYTTYPIHRTQPEFNQECVAIVSDILARQVDGMIFHGAVPPAVHEMVREKRLPTVYSDAGLECRGARVAINRLQGIRQAVDHLKELGHREVGFVITAQDHHQPHHKLGIYREAIEQAGLTPVFNADWVVSLADDSEGQVFDFISRQAKAGSLPTAIMMNNDEHAVAALFALEQAGYHVPRDISVVGFDDVSFARFTHPPLTTIRMPGVEVGQAAMEMLLRLMQAGRRAGGEAAPCVSFDTQLVVRETTGPAPAAARRRSRTA